MLFRSPGPGEYNNICIRDIRNVKSHNDCTFGNKQTKTELSMTPGPGNYFPEIAERVMHKFAMCKANRGHSGNTSYTDQYYNSVDLYKGPSIKFGLGKRESEIKKSRIPGPGSYEPISYIGQLPEYATRSEKN